MALQPGERWQLVRIGAFVAACVTIGGVWPWLIR